MYTAARPLRGIMEGRQHVRIPGLVVPRSADFDHVLLVRALLGHKVKVLAVEKLAGLEPVQHHGGLLSHLARRVPRDPGVLLLRLLRLAHRLPTQRALQRRHSRQLRPVRGKQTSGERELPQGVQRVKCQAVTVTAPRCCAPADPRRHPEGGNTSTPPATRRAVACIRSVAALAARHADPSY
jgi:hypothetical protein